MLLLVFESVCHGIDFYVMDNDHPQAENARESNGMVLNEDDIDPDHPIFELYDWLDTDEAKAMRVKTPYKGCITEVCHFGVLL